MEDGSTTLQCDIDMRSTFLVRVGVEVTVKLWLHCPTWVDLLWKGEERIKSNKSLIALAMIHVHLQYHIDIYSTVDFSFYANYCRNR